MRVSAIGSALQDPPKKLRFGARKPLKKECSMDDSVAKDAKRLLLRYGAPIAVVDQLSESERITYARSILRTSVPDRPAHLREMLTDDGRLVAR
jgi:hypothetical protein